MKVKISWEMIMDTDELQREYYGHTLQDVKNAFYEMCGSSDISEEVFDNAKYEVVKE